jgi:hypothetical protein
MIKEYEFYHGVVFTKLIHGIDEVSCIRAYSKISNAAYVLNNDIGLYIKHSTKRMSPWSFSFLKAHQDEILEMAQNLKEVFLILVCGEDGMVTLPFKDLKQILDDEHNDIEWISASRKPRKEYTIKGSDGSLGRKVGKSDFPQKIVDAIKKHQIDNIENLKSTNSEECKLSV